MQDPEGLLGARDAVTLLAGLLKQLHSDWLEARVSELHEDPAVAGETPAEVVASAFLSGKAQAPIAEHVAAFLTRPLGDSHFPYVSIQGAADRRPGRGRARKVLTAVAVGVMSAGVR